MNDKAKKWAESRARYGQAKFITAEPGLPTNEHAPEVMTGKYLDDALEFCVSATCSCTYRYECEEGDEHGHTCDDPACKTFCT